MSAFHLVTQVDTSIVLYYSLNAKKDKVMFVLTCIQLLNGKTSDVFS